MLLRGLTRGLLRGLKRGISVSLYGRLVPIPVNVEAGQDTNAGLSLTILTGSQTPVKNELQVLTILSMHGTTAETPTSVTGCGLTWELVTGGERFLGASGTTRKLTRFAAFGPAPTAGQLTMTFATAMTGVNWIWDRVPGAKVSGTVQQAFRNAFSAGAAAATTINATLPAAMEHPNNIHYCAVGIGTSATVTPDPDFAELADRDAGGGAPTGTIETEWARAQLACDPTFSSAVSGILSHEILAGP